MTPLKINSLSRTLFTFWILSSIYYAIAWPSAQTDPPDNSNDGIDDAPGGGGDDSSDSQKPQEEEITFLVNYQPLKKSFPSPSGMTVLTRPVDINFARIEQAPSDYGCFFISRQNPSDGTGTDFHAKFTSQTFYSPDVPNVTSASDAANIILPNAHYMTCFRLPDSKTANEIVGVWFEYVRGDTPPVSSDNLVDPQLRTYFYATAPYKADKDYGQVAVFDGNGMRLERLALVHDLAVNTECKMSFYFGGRLAEIFFSSTTGLAGPFENVQSVICYPTI